MSEVTVSIFNHSYRLAVSVGEEELLHRCAKLVDEQMSAVRAAGKVIAADQIAVLSALELAYEAEKAKLEREAEEKAREESAEKTSAEPPVQPHAPGCGAAENSAGDALLDEIRSLCTLCENALMKDALAGTRF